MEKGASAAAAADTALPGLQGWVGVTEDLVLLSRYISSSATKRKHRASFIFRHRLVTCDSDWFLRRGFPNNCGRYLIKNTNLSHIKKQVSGTAGH